MSVLKGEGTTVILYGATNVSTGGSSYGGYLARPDLMGEWPTVVVVSPTEDTASSVKDVCRLMARHGIAAVAPESGGLDPFIGFITNPAGHWSNAEYGFGVLGLGDGSVPAILEAASSDLVAALALVDPTLDENSIEALEAVDVPLLGCAARFDDLDRVRSAAPQAEWIIYDGAGAGYWNINSDAYVSTVAEDTADRVVEFFAGPLPAKI